MRVEEINQEASRLGLADKLLLSELPLPDWQKRELDKRYKEYKTGKQKLYDWKSVHEGLRNEYK
jgi:hypothetical protein